MKLFKNFISVIAIAFMLFISTSYQANADSKLEVHYIDLDYGESVYIELPDGTDILIDAGNRIQVSKVVEYLKNQEPDMDIEYLIATNLASNRMGGFETILKEFKVEKLYYPHQLATNGTDYVLDPILKLAKEQGCSIVDSNRLFTIHQDKDISIGFLSTYYSSGVGDNRNGSSIILLDYNDVEMLFMGDVQSEVEERILYYGYEYPKNVEIFKASDHASENTSSKEFLDRIKPKHTIISGREDDMYPDTLNRIKQSGSTIWKNATSGNIVVTTDGKDYSIIDSNGKNYNSGRWEYIDGKWYYIVQGVKQTGWLKDSEKWYYLDSNGVMQTGWLNINGTWYYLESSGVMATGWKQINGTWYYLRTSGAMATGWLDLNGTWYYLKSSGAMATGWLDLNGTWYYLRSSGKMATGWLDLNGTWYYLRTSGKMVTGWLDLSGNWYYLKSSGKMATGWQQVGSNWYYLYSSGVMATNTVIDNWSINHNGVATYIGSSNGGSSNTNSSTVYITPGGKSYHNSRNCTTLKRSTTIISTTLSQAKAQGKSDPCNVCVR